MKISGIAGGRNRGDVVELTEDKKIHVAIGVGLVPWSETYKEGKYLAFCTEVEIASNSSSPHGDPLKKKWANNVYRAKGKLKLHLRNRVKDIILEPKSRNFEIEFYDKLDSMGLPDLEVKSLIIK